MLDPKRKRKKRSLGSKTNPKLSTEDMFFASSANPPMLKPIQPTVGGFEEEAERQRHRNHILTFANRYGHRRSAQFYWDSDYRDRPTGIFSGLTIETAALMTALGCTPDIQPTKDELDTLKLEAMFGLIDPR